MAATLRLGTAYERAAVAFWNSVAGDPASAPTGMSLRFEVFVADLEATVDFYSRVLGFAVAKDGNDELLAAINDAIASDEYDAVYEEWFGTAPAE